MHLLKVGNRIINPDHILHVSYEPTAYHPATADTWRECTVSFSGEEYEIFYNEEADQVWAYLSTAMHCRTLSTRATSPSEFAA
jgi:hypothetical protein